MDGRGHVLRSEKLAPSTAHGIGVTFEVAVPDAGVVRPYAALVPQLDAYSSLQVDDVSLVLVNPCLAP